LLLECIAPERRQGADLLVFTPNECALNEKRSPASSLPVDRQTMAGDRVLSFSGSLFLVSLRVCREWLSFVTAAAAAAGLISDGWEIDPR
jgi:hypothetical protein